MADPTPPAMPAEATPDAAPVDAAPDPVPRAQVVTRARFTAGYADAEGTIPLAFIPGVPARNLTAADWQALDADQQALVTDSGIYTLTRKDAPDA